MPGSRKRLTAGAAIALVLAGLSLAAAMGASARDGHGRDDGDRDRSRPNAAAVFSSALAPSIPTDPTIHAVVPGGLPWVIGRSSVRIDADGRIDVRIHGLVIPIAHGALPAGTPRPVTVVAASLYCAPESSAAVATTPSVPISEDGDATISTRIDLPAKCLAPIVLVNPNNSAGAYIAASGWKA